MSALPGWHSVESTSAIAHWLHITAVVVLGVLVVSEAMALAYDSRKEDLTGKIHAAEVARLQADISSRQPRTITPDQHRALVELLRPDRIIKGPVLINPAMDGEAWQFAKQILEVLKEAGFDAKEVPDGQRALAFSKPGAFIWMKDAKNQPRHGGPIAKAFGIVGIPLVGEERPNDVPDANMVVIAVSSHP